MTFSGDLRRFTATVQTRSRDVFVGTCTEVLRSIVEGSEITGAPGQPVGQYGPGYHPGSVGGTLKASWQLTFPEPNAGLVSTNLVYAPPIEDGVSGRGTQLTLRSSVGGFHSVKLTRAGLPRIVESETARVAGKNGA